MEFTTGGRLEVRITASDVGKRVSVRSLTGSGDSGATYTDTVGVLTSWTAGVLSITRRGGESVRVSASDMVAAKAIPDVPARRRGLPSAGVRELTEVAARGWPAARTERLGGWVLRASDGFTARANSVLPLDDPGMPLPEAAARVERWYAERGLVPRVQVATGGGNGGELRAAELERLGWTAERHAVMRVAALAPLADRAPDERVRLSREPGADWLSMYRSERRAGELPPAARRVLTGGPSVWFATVSGGPDSAVGASDSASAGSSADSDDARGPDAEGLGPSRPAAIGRCVVDGRWAGFAALEVAPEWRRRGLATAVMGELARQALAEGASAAYLQVETGNSAALTLYDGLGFADHHTYHYRRAPQNGAA